MAPTRQSPILLYLVILLGFVLGYLYNSSLDPTAAAPPIAPNFQLSSLRGLDGIKINYSVLSIPQFQELRVFGQLPVQPGAGGSGNIFQ